MPAVELVVLVAAGLVRVSIVHGVVIGEIVGVKRDDLMTFACAPPGAEPLLIAQELHLPVDVWLFER